MRLRSIKKTDRFQRVTLSIVFLSAALLIGAVPRAYAATMVQNRFDKTGDASASAVTTHEIGFDYTDFAVPIGSVKFEFCQNDPIPETACTAPPGFDASAATLAAQTGFGGFSIDSSSNQNNLILTRLAVIPTAGASTYRFDNVINPNQVGTYYVRITTHTSTDASGAAVQSGGIALSVVEPFTLSTEVPPHLTFCVGITIVGFDCSTANSYFTDLGELSKTQTRVASSQMMATTNAAFGYTIFATGTTLTSGNHIIPPLGSPTNSSTGTSQFGLNLRSNSQPNIGDEPQGPGTAVPAAGYNVPNKYKFVSGDGIVTATSSQDYRKFTTSYIVNISNAQEPGIYATTITYICLANF